MDSSPLWTLKNPLKGRRSNMKSPRPAAARHFTRERLFFNLLDTKLGPQGTGREIQLSPFDPKIGLIGYNWMKKCREQLLQEHIKKIEEKIFTCTRELTHNKKTSPRVKNNLPAIGCCPTPNPSAATIHSSHNCYYGKVQKKQKKITNKC